MTPNPLARAAALAVALLAAFASARAQDGAPQPALPKTSDEAIVERARVLKKPVYPAEARDGGVVGTVTVRVQVGPDGEVIWARAVAGPEPLRATAVAAARTWEFTSTDAPDRVTGYLVFRFSSGSRYAAIVGVHDDEVADTGASAGEPTPTAQPPRPAPAPARGPAPASKPATTIRRVGDGALIAAARRKVAPQYPASARSARIEGPVVVEVEVDETGRVTSARAISGHSLLRDAAVAAARQWTFAPPEGAPARVIGTISFNFKL